MIEFPIRLGDKFRLVDTDEVFLEPKYYILARLPVNQGWLYGLVSLDDGNVWHRGAVLADSSGLIGQEHEEELFDSRYSSWAKWEKVTDEETK